MNLSRRSLTLLSRAVVLTALVGGAALAQVGGCPAGSARTQASCGGDTCECSPECATHEQCSTGCCFEGFCAIACVCDTPGATVNTQCLENAGCGSTVAPSAPLTGGGMGWGMGLFAVGALGLAGGGKRGRKWKAGAALTLCLLGAAMVGVSAFGTAPLSTVKGLKATASR